MEPKGIHLFEECTIYINGEEIKLPAEIPTIHITPDENSMDVSFLTATPAIQLTWELSKWENLKLLWFFYIQRNVSFLKTALRIMKAKKPSQLRHISKNNDDMIHRNDLSGIIKNDLWDVRHPSKEPIIRGGTVVKIIGKEETSTGAIFNIIYNGEPTPIDACNIDVIE